MKKKRSGGKGKKGKVVEKKRHSGPLIAALRKWRQVVPSELQAGLSLTFLYLPDMVRCKFYSISATVWIKEERGLLLLKILVGMP